MENEKILTIRLQLTRRKALLLLTLFFICWHPGFLGSENLVLTTYYPAPYGGYVSLLTTSDTILARDIKPGNVESRVGIGTAAPTVKLDVAQNTAMRVGRGYVSSGGDYLHLANNEWYDGGQWQHPGNLSGALIQLTGQSVNFYRHNGFGTHTLSMTVDPAGNVGIGTSSPGVRLAISGDMTVSGMISGMCRAVGYGINWGGGCAWNERVMGWYGDGNATNGMLFYGGALNNPGAWSPYVSVGADRGGTLWCCRIQ